MAGVDSLIRAMLRERLATLASVPPVAYEGYEYTPVVGTTFFRERLVFQDSRVTSLGPYARLKHEGVWMLDIYCPGNKGFSVVDDWADKVKTHFAPGTVLTKSGTTLRFSRAFAGAAIVSPQWTMRPCMIDWFTESTNTV